MLVLVAAPTATVIFQSFFSLPAKTLTATEICGPFGCTEQTGVLADEAASSISQNRFVGLAHYRDRAHLAIDEIRERWRTSNSIRVFVNQVMALPFYAALLFTLLYTLVVTPLAIVLGLWLACTIKRLHSRYRAPVVFVTLLPMVVTPLMGALALFWMLDSYAVLGAALRTLSGSDSFSIRASMPLTWLVLLLHGIWQSAPLAFVVYYAGLHTVPRTLIESARVDGASRWQILRYVTLPHLLPMTVFLLLVQLMDNFRVLDPIVGFGADAFARSLSFNVFADLQSNAVRFNSATTTSTLMIIVLAVMLTPLLVWLVRHNTQHSLHKKYGRSVHV